jgi:hypothetical protein
MRLHRPALVVGLALATLTVPTPAGADVVDTATVSTDPAGAHVQLRRDGTWAETRGSGAAGPTTGCRRRWVLLDRPYALRPTPMGQYREVDMDAPPGPDFQPYQVWCDDGTTETYVDTVWLRPQQFGVDPRVIAEQLLRDLPYPAATVGASPDGRGLTGLASWFWVDGYTGAPIVDTVSQFGLTVTVEATPASTDWDFGDGTVGNRLGLGAPPPAATDVTHVYEVRGRPSYRVRALIRLAVRWRLGAGPWQDLAPIVRTAVRDYPVVSSRAALVPDR